MGVDSVEEAATELRQVKDLGRQNVARAGDLVLDCVVVEPEEWWVGYHRASGVASRWPGGLFQSELPAEAVSRAYLKMAEALAWSRMPTKKGEQWAEIGSAPGGASQALLKQGVKVIGIDPAEMDPAVLANPDFTALEETRSGRAAAGVSRREVFGGGYQCGAELHARYGREYRHASGGEYSRPVINAEIVGVEIGG